MKIRILKNRFRLIKNITLSIFVIILFLVALEIFTRVRYDEYSIGLGYGAPVIKFQEKYYLLNSKGFRDREFSYEKENNTYRILVLGDSIAFGQGIKNMEDTFPKLLEKRLNQNKSSITYEVINTGRQGYGTKDELEFWNNEGFKYNPDFVIIAYYINDIEEQPTPKDPGQGTLNRVTTFLNERSYAYFFLKYKLANSIRNIWLYEIKPFFGKDYEEESNSTKIMNQHSEDFKGLIKAIKNKGSKPIAVMLPPTFIHFFDPNEHFVYIEKVTNVMEVDYIELKMINDVLNSTNLRVIVNKDNHHPNELAHKIMADEIYFKLVKSHLINASS